MPATTNPTRTTFLIGNETRSGARCSACGSLYVNCTGNVLSGRRACCARCADTDTHDVEVVESPPAPTTPTREVRQNALRVIHKTTEPEHRQTRVPTVCGTEVLTSVAFPRTWRGGTGNSTLTECEVCFAPEPVVYEPEPEPRAVEVRANANPVVHLTHDGTMQPNTLCGERLSYKVRDPRRWSGHPVRPITDCPECFAMQPRIPEQPVPEVLHALELCERSGHIGEPHTHTVGADALWGTPNQNRTNADRVRHGDGTEVLFANAAHIAAATENPVTETTERESTVPEPRFPVGTDIFPIDGAKLVDLPIGSVLTIRSRNRGELRGGAIHFGCQSWMLDQLRQARATVEFQPNGGVVVTADVTVIDRGNGLLVAGQRQSLGDVNEYAASIIVKEVAVALPDNAVVMEHGFYGCAQHPDHVIIVGMGHANNRSPARPLVGMVRKAGGGPELTGTVGVTEGLRHPSMSECTPVWGSTTAHTMNFASERRYSLVPCTPEQIERMGRRQVVAHIEGTEVVACDSAGQVDTVEPSPF